MDYAIAVPVAVPVILVIGDRAEWHCQQRIKYK